jgi:hypothetical protein
MNFSILTESNYLLYAIKHYDNPNCSGTNEFEEDIGRIAYIKKLFNRYQTTGVLKERLILNHIIVFYNMFGVEAATRLMFFLMGEEHHSLLKTFLTYLSYLKPDHKVSDYGIDLNRIPLDTFVVAKLRSVNG